MANQVAALALDEEGYVAIDKLGGDAVKLGEVRTGKRLGARR